MLVYIIIWSTLKVRPHVSFDNITQQQQQLHITGMFEYKLLMLNVVRERLCKDVT